MATVSNREMLDEDGSFKVFVAGATLGRPKLPATMSVATHKFRAPKAVPVESGVKAPATKPTYGHVRISKYSKDFAGMDRMGFMS